MKKEDYTQLSMSDLVEKAKEEKLQYAKMKFNHSISPVENPMKIRTARKNIARMVTELKKRELAEAKK
mgnify:FL=1